MARISHKKHKQATDVAGLVAIITVIAISILAGMKIEVPQILTIIASTAAGVALGLPMIPKDDDDERDELSTHRAPKGGRRIPGTSPDREDGDPSYTYEIGQGKPNSEGD